MNTGNGESKRNILRARLFSPKQFRSELLDLFGSEVEIRQPSVGDILSIAQQAEDSKSAIVRTLIDYCYVPGTNEKVFEDADEESILKWPSDAWITKLNEAIMRLSNIDVEASEKNLSQAETSKP